LLREFSGDGAERRVALTELHGFPDNGLFDLVGLLVHAVDREPEPARNSAHSFAASALCLERVLDSLRATLLVFSNPAQRRGLDGEFGLACTDDPYADLVQLQRDPGGARSARGKVIEPENEDDFEGLGAGPSEQALELRTGPSAAQRLQVPPDDRVALSVGEALQGGEGNLGPLLIVRERQVQRRS
jgi:hypothetical protein